MEFKPFHKGDNDVRRSGRVRRFDDAGITVGFQLPGQIISEASKHFLEPAPDRRISKTEVIESEMDARIDRPGPFQ